MSVDLGATALACGTDPLELLTQLTEGTPPPEGAHQASCGICQGALVEFEAAWAPVRHWLEEPVRAPAWLVHAVMTRIRHMTSGPSVRVAVTSRGQTEVRSWVIRLVAAGAALRSEGVVALGQHRPRQRSGRGRGGDPSWILAAASNVALHWDGSALRLAFPVIAELGASLDQLADHVRQLVENELGARVGIEPTSIDIEISDVVAPPSSPARR